MEKIKNNFHETEQQLFISSFYCYLNYHPLNDFVVDLDNVWKWLEFSTKQKAKILLEKQFIIDKDYKHLLNPTRRIATNPQDKQKTEGRGGHNKEKIMLNINTFKLFCIKANTKKANEIHSYFVKLEQLLFETIQEECKDFKEQLESQKKIGIDREIDNQKQQMTLREQTILQQFPSNTQCVYYGSIDNKSKNGEKLIKFGCSHHLRDRVKQHKRTFENFFLLNAFKVDNCQYIENAMKNHPSLCKIRHTIKIKNTNYTELLLISEISYDKLNEIIKDIISKIEYSPENYTALLNKVVKFEKFIVYNMKQTGEKCEEMREEEDQNIKLYSKVRVHNKAKDGKYHIHNKIYDKLYGSRQEVWDEISYQTAGDLKKNDLMISTSINNNGKIISKAKHNYEKTLPNFRFNSKNKHAIEEAKQTINLTTTKTLPLENLTYINQTLPPENLTKQNKEKISKQRREYRERNKEKISKQRNEGRERNKEKILEYYATNREQILKQRREYRERNKEKILEYYATNREQLLKQRREKKNQAT